MEIFEWENYYLWFVGWTVLVGILGGLGFCFGFIIFFMCDFGWFFNNWDLFFCLVSREFGLVIFERFFSFKC